MLREALRELVAAPAYRDVCAAGLIGGFSEVERAEYDLLLDWRREAAEQGVTRL
jgi:hypothetical protein